MDNIRYVINSWTIIILAAIIVVVILLIILLVRILRTRALIKQEAAACAESHPTFQPSYAFTLSPQVFAANFHLVKNLSLRYGINLPVLTRLDEYWIEKFEKNPTPSLLDKLLTYSPYKALFPIFRASLDSDTLFSRLYTWIIKSGELMIMRTLAQSCGGRSFNGKRALELTAEWRDELYEMTGDPRWESRWFSLQILLNAEDERAQRAIWTSFADSSYFIRKLVAQRCTTDDSDRLYSALQDLLLNDPVLEVRRSARVRIENDFLELYSIPSSLTQTQKLHLTELLNPEMQQDREFAFSLLDSSNEELTLAASAVLTRSGSLRRLFQQIFFEDKESMKRSLHLLTNAAKVHTTVFLNTIEECTNPGTLYVAAELLRDYGDRKYITSLIEQVRRFNEIEKQKEPIRSIYVKAMETACIRGDDNALGLVRDELIQRKNDEGLHAVILPQLPAEHAHVYIEMLFSFLRDHSYRQKSILRAALSALQPDMTLPTLFEIIKSDDETADAAVQEQALRVLCEIGIPYTLQHVLEHLPLLSVEKASRYSALLGEHFSKNYQERVRELLKSTDSRLRSRLISSLPARFHDNFRTELYEALRDSDQEVRSACAWTLVAHGNSEDQEACTSLLHDPVEEVRINTSRAFARYGGTAHLKELKKMLNNSSEMIPVKNTIIDGLSSSEQPESVDLLVEQIFLGGELRDRALLSLSKKRQGPMVLRILSHIKKADPPNRGLLIETIRNMGKSAESFLEEFLFDTADSLKSIAVDVLESIGTIDAQIRQLSHRDPAVRGEAAAFLFKVGTLNAYRGLIQAARDPDEEVRTYVVKALDELNSDRGKKILEELQNDPQKRVRTYTNWALERYTARRL